MLWILLLGCVVLVEGQRGSFSQSSSSDLREVEMSRYMRRMDQWKAQREAYKQLVQAQRDRYYQDYFDRMKEYGRTVERQRYVQLLQKQAQERAKLEESMKYWGVGGVPEGMRSEPASPRPSDPFGANVQQATSGQRQSLETITRDSTALQSLCQRYLPTVRLHCNGQIERGYQEKCQGFYQDCQQYIYRGDPLYSTAHSFSSGVGLNLGSWAVKGIPYYPINEEGAIGAGHLMNIPFGSWGGGFTDHIGVRDYWSQYTEIGANWYDGKYGYKSGWSAPLVQSLGVEGDLHATASVPIRPGELGKPIGVDVGGGVGPYYQQNQHVGVDYLNGRVGTNFGVAVPFTGVGVNTGLGIKFPSIADIQG